MTANAVNVNWYPNGEAGIGWHSDDEALFPEEKRGNNNRLTIVGRHTNNGIQR